MVRLRALTATPSSGYQFEFQFQYGAIKGVLWCLDSFFGAQFQFQYGAIKGQGLAYVPQHLHTFQFQYGAIKGFVVQEFLLYLFDFNSNMVRLRDPLSTLA